MSRRGDHAVDSPPPTITGFCKSSVTMWSTAGRKVMSLRGQKWNLFHKRELKGQDFKSETQFPQEMKML